MGASRFRCLDPTGNGVGGRSSWCVPRGHVGGRHATIGWLVALIVLDAGLLPAGRARAQEAQPKSEAAKIAEPAEAHVEPLSARYRFTETYAVEENATKPELITQYQVGSLETNRVEVENAQGAPDRSEGSIQVIYTERAAKVNKLGEVTDLVRRYDGFRAGGIYQAVEATPPMIKGLSVWCTLQRYGVPKILSLTDQRPLRQEEYNLINEKLFLPQLSSVLPPTPTRIGDTWEITRRTSRSLLGNAVPDDGEFDVRGRLVEVRKAPGGNTLTARIEITGQLTIDSAPAGVKAWIFFVFEPPPAAEPGTNPKAESSKGIIEARGQIARVQMTRRLSTPIDDNGRLNRILTRELTMARRAASSPLNIPATPPVADKANSWIRYDDPDGRFHFIHPQELRLASDTSQNPDLLEFVDRKLTGTDAVIFNIQREDKDAARNRQLLDPNYHIRDMRATWQKTKQDVMEGDAGWLPNDPQSPGNRRVHRFEAALKNGPSGTRTYCNQYLLLDTKGSIVVMALTERNDHLVFRNEVEDMIKSFEFDQRQGVGVPATRPTPGTGPAGAAPAVPQPRPR